ncbi:PREDICTED: uncharacterized protein LOC109147069 isoform X2 [Ipomoea nil]|uniref:uncharacterized protein LOC109147069 isoform X2 n=1 Tax=Ipomoea nil TaxID=35883 RepID=UPI000901D6CE|nr:PREDICTED: uncharacterized protein LOC109147069 isoform X2 [Ipomoea nil]
MDYDDNDYQSQNFHIVGDDSSKVSSVLCPYALPKFDFDESLQGHLRFDSLVENEVFLGIPSQEDNQWIEEYSRGSSGIEFSPSAAESCSIPRRNNVWSEAASSESVEMLLKSVIQEHNLPVDAIIEESDAGNELGNLSQQIMEPNLREDDKVDYDKDSNPGVQPDEFSRSKETTGAEVIQMALETQVVETCAYENIESRENDQIMTDDSIQIEVKNNDSNKVEVGTLDNETVNQTKGNPSASGVQVQGEECSSHTVTVGNSSEWDKQSGIRLETTSGLPNDFCKGAGDNTIVSEDTTINDEKLSGVAFQTGIPAVNKDSPSNVTSEVVGVNEARGENRITNLAESSSLLEISDHDLSTAEVCKKDVPFVEPPKDNKSDIVALPKATKIQHQYDDCSMLQDETSVAFKSTSAPDGHVAEVRDVEGLETCSNLELEKCSALNIPSGLSKIAQQNTTESFISSDQRPSFASSGGLSEPFGPQTESSIDQGGECDSIMESSTSAGILEERHATEDLKGGNVCVGADKVVSGIAHDPSSLSKAECVQLYRENLPSEVPVDACNSDQDNSSGEKRRAMSCAVLSNEEGDKSLDSHIRVGSSSTIEEHKEDVEITCAPEFGTSVQNKQASAVEVKDVNCSSHDTMDNVNSLSKHSDIPPVMVNHPEQKPLSVKESSMHFGNEEMNTICPKEASPSTLGSSVQMIVKASHITTAAADADAGQDCSKDLKIRGVQHDLTMREGTCDKTETIEKHEEANNDGQDLPKFGEIGSSVEPVAPSQVSTSITNYTQPLQTEKNKEEFGNRAAVESIPTPQVTDNFVGKVQSMCMNSGVSASSKEESLNIKVTPVAGSSEVEPSKDMQSFPSNRSEVPMVGEELPLISVGANAGKENPQVSDQITPSRGSKAGSERKTRGGSSKTGRKSTKGNQLKETPVKVIERRDKSRVARESSGTKTSGVVSTPTSNLPDLNTSTQSVLFQQPFTDLQQVQFRAQIFVYGSLIQGAVPDEACMVSAFGTTDGGRGTWEAAWRACLERHLGQRSHAINTETPVRSRSGAKTPDQAINQGLQQSKVLSSAAARSSSKGSSTPIVTPMIPLSSPLWNIATPSCDSRVSSSVVSGAVVDYQSFSSLNPYQIPPGRNLAGYTTWLSQTSLPAPWVASTQTAAFDVSTRFPVLPITEPVKLTPVKESSMAASGGTKHMPTNSMAPSVLSGIIAGNTSMIDNKKAPASPADPKSRKRKKPSVTDGHGQISLPVAPAELVSAPSSSGYSSKSVGLISSVGRSPSQTLSAPVVSSHFSTLVAVTTSPSFVPKGKSDLVTASSLLVDHSKRAEINVVRRTLTPEDIKNVEEAKLQAEEASAHAAAALGHFQGIWIELDKQKSSSLMPDVEAKLASAAVAIAAAASVAKAAAAAAKVASDAAAQVKRIADEALVSSKSVTIENSAVALSNSVSNLGSATPASILKSGDGNFVRIEAMSAASRHAENLMAVVKAAELAAEAVSHAGKVVIGDPLPLSELVKAGPDGFWKVSESMSQSKDVNGGKSGVNMVEQGSDVFPKQSAGPSVKALRALKGGLSPHPGGTSANTIAGSVRAEEGISSSILHADKDICSNKGPTTSEFNKTLDISTGPEIESRSTSLLHGDYGNIASSMIDSIKEGCLVEVLRGSGDLKAWFSANVLSLKDGAAFICYTELQSDEGSGQLKEWIPLRLDGEDVPSIRISHPMTAVHLEGARKRRRAAMKDYTWSVGDRVDAWMDNCWREGIITEKNKKDETILSVNFPARGDTAVVRAWNLRPTLIWKDGEWVEWSTSRNEPAFQGDTPKEKRMKLGNPAGETSGKAKLSKNIDLPEPGTNKEPKLLPLSDNEKIFNVGSNKDENKPSTVRTMRSGLQKEGSKVVFGVPKPGKKRKFMDVSKHYVSSWGMKDTTANDSAKLAKYVMPQGSGVGGWKNNSKTNPKEKEVAEFKSRPPKSRKPPSSSRTSKDNSLTSNPSASGDATSTDHVVKDTMSYDKNESAQSDFVKCNSNVEEAAEGHMQFSSEDLQAESTKKVSTSTNKSEKVNAGNVAPASGKSTKVEVDKSIPEVTEPRRSNRRIQPTSRLLEGLQSSLIIPKFPSLSHDKGHRSHHRGTSKGNSHG